MHGPINPELLENAENRTSMNIQCLGYFLVTFSLFVPINNLSSELYRPFLFFYHVSNIQPQPTGSTNLSSPNLKHI